MGKGKTPKSTRATLTTAQQSLFIANIKGKDYSKISFKDLSGRVPKPFREMTIGQHTPGGKWGFDKRQMELPDNYKGTRAIVRREYKQYVDSKKLIGKHKFTREAWAAHQGGGAITLNYRQFQQHLAAVAHQIPIASEHWRMVLARRALATFQESFKLKRFNSAGGGRWKSISEWTKNKRKGIVNMVGKDKRYWKSHWPGKGKLMRETDKLLDSLHVVDGPVITSVVASAPYAGVHNCPTPGMTYGNGFGHIFNPPKPVVQRQFMGHSTKIDDFISAYESNYLFTNVFRKPV